MSIKTIQQQKAGHATIIKVIIDVHNLTIYERKKKNLSKYKK